MADPDFSVNDLKVIVVTLRDELDEVRFELANEKARAEKYAGEITRLVKTLMEYRLAEALKECDDG